jgi:hypothetical protein
VYALRTTNPPPDGRIDAVTRWIVVIRAAVLPMTLFAGLVAALLAVGKADLIRAEADAGRTFLWYTSEADELKNCDHVYVFRSGRIIADLHRGELSEERVIQSSFQEVT